MGKIRNWLVRNFLLESWVTLFSKQIHFLRAGRVLFPLTGIVGMIITTDPLYPILQWWDYVLLFIWFLGMYFGFSFFKWSYFNKWPATVDELDDEQRFGHYRARLSGELTNARYIKSIDENGNEVLKHQQNLTDEEWQDYDVLTKMMEKKHSGKFANVWSLVPLVGVIILVVLWFFFIFPHFNPDWVEPINPRRFF